MTRFVTALFLSEAHATAAMNRLEQAGIRRDDIDIWSTPHNLASFLEDEGVSRADAYAYAEGVRRGGSLVIVKCDGEIDRVVSILDQEGILDLDEQQATWRSEGWQGVAGLVGAGDDADAARSSVSTPAMSDPSTDVQTDEAGRGRVRIQIRDRESPAPD